VEVPSAIIESKELVRLRRAAAMVRIRSLEIVHHAKVGHPGGDVVTSFAISRGVRDANSMWTPVEANKFLSDTKAVGGSIAAAEMFGEPTE